MKKLGSKKTLPELAVEQIIGYINENGLQPGDQLPNEVDLMNKLKVGRGTIREAIKSLNSKGVVIIKRGIGTFVADQPGISDDPLGFTFETDKTKVLMDALEVRLLIEPQMIIKTIDNISAKQLKELSDLADEIESLINKNKDYTVQDIEFHTLLATASTIKRCVIIVSWTRDLSVTSIACSIAPAIIGINFPITRLPLTRANKV